MHFVLPRWQLPFVSASYFCSPLFQMPNQIVITVAIWFWSPDQPNRNKKHFANASQNVGPEAFSDLSAGAVVSKGGPIRGEPFACLFILIMKTRTNGEKTVVSST
jgi:hypothetical protein